MDLLSAQISLGELEEHFRLLRHETESKLELLLAECDSQAKERDEDQQKIEKLTLKVSTMAVELEAERRQRVIAEEAVNELKHQLEEDSRSLVELEAERRQRAIAEEAVNELKHQLEQNSKSLNEKRDQAKTASEEAELVRLQLNQVQEEMEHYFLQSRSKDKLLQRHHIQQQRIKKLISNLITNTNLKIYCSDSVRN